MSRGIVGIYNDLAQRIWNQMVELVGVHACAVLVQRALWVTRQQYGDREGFIELREDGICFGSVEGGIDHGEFKAMAEEFFSSLIRILTRLVGMEIAQRLNDDMDRLLQGAGDDLP